MLQFLVNKEYFSAMNLNPKGKGLIGMAIITLIALIAIQAYLVYNTYELKKKTFVIDARNAVAKIYTSPEIDSIMWLYRNDFLNQLEAYQNGVTDKYTLLKKLQSKSEEINPGFLSIFNSGLETYPENFKIKIKKIVTSIIITDSTGNKNILYELPSSDTIVLLGESFKTDEGILINTSSWKKEHEYMKGGLQEAVDLDFQSNVFMNIEDWNEVLIRELSGLLIISSFLFLFVVSLMYYSIQNLFKQKRLADVKTDFINNITHELKTPLSTLSLATKTLTSQHARADEEITKAAIDTINRQNARLQKLVDQVMQSSLGYQQINLSREAINATTFLNELLDDFQLSISSEIHIKRDIENTGLSLFSDKFYLSTSIINILNNAIKYGGTELIVSYTIDQSDGTHLISIRDNGIGISPKYHKYIFQKFYRVSERDTHNYKGLGLGLYYTYQIIIAHNGTIEVKSKVNEGAEFLIKIPIIS